MFECVLMEKVHHIPVYASAGYILHKSGLKEGRRKPHLTYSRQSLYVIGKRALVAPGAYYGTNARGCGISVAVQRLRQRGDGSGSALAMAARQPRRQRLVRQRH